MNGLILGFVYYVSTSIQYPPKAGMGVERGEVGELSKYDRQIQHTNCSVDFHLARAKGPCAG